MTIIFLPLGRGGANGSTGGLFSIPRGPRASTIKRNQSTVIWARRSALMGSQTRCPAKRFGLLEHDTLALSRGTSVFVF